MLLVILSVLLFSCHQQHQQVYDLSGINWEKSLKTAQQISKIQKRPIFLYFSAVWCSWCREYEKELSEVKELVEKYYVPLNLDSDREGEIFTRFGGRGTPFTVIIDPDGRVITKFHGALKSKDLQKILTMSIGKQKPLKKSEKDFYTLKVNKETYNFLLNYFLDDLQIRFDPELGGFTSPSQEGFSLKWPTPLTYSYLLNKGILVDEALISLKKDIEFLYDPVDGGFFNFYDRTRAFDIYFETSKTLRVNAQMITALISAYRTTGDEIYLKIAKETYKYLKITLYHRGTGCFLNAQISMPDYYNLPPEERVRKDPPPTDSAIIVEDNAYTIIALKELFNETKEEKYLKDAKICLKFILNNLVSEKGVYRYYDIRTGQKGSINFHRDVIQLAIAITHLDLYNRAKNLVIDKLTEEVYKDPLSFYSASYLLAIIDRERSKRFIEDSKISLSYQNPDHFVYLLLAFEKILGL